MGIPLTYPVINSQSSLVLRFVNNDFQENKEPTIGGTIDPISSPHPSPELILGDNNAAAFLTQKCSLPSRTIKFEIWDTAGQERFASLAPMYYRNAQTALVVYDITKPSSLVKAKHWVAELQRQASPGIVIALVGNKLDLANEDVGGSGQGSLGESEGSGSPGAEDTEGGAEGGEDGNDADVEDVAAGDARKISKDEASRYAGEEGLLFFETSAKTGLNVAEVFTAIANAIPETSLKTSKGPGPGAGAGQSGITAGGRQGDEARINLRERNAATAKDGCAC